MMGLMVVGCTLLLCVLVDRTAIPEQVVKAPGSQIPGAPLPRYVYNVVAADFSVPSGPPLSKSKFNLYDPVGPTTAQFDASVDKMRGLNVDTYRLELAWGRQRSGMGLHTGVGGTPDKLTYDFAPLDHIVSKLHGVNVRLLASYSYTPPPLQDPTLKPTYEGGKRRETTPPRDTAKFGEAVASFARHYNELGMPVGSTKSGMSPTALTASSRVQTPNIFSSSNHR